MEESAKERWQEITAAGDSIAMKIELLRRFVRDFPQIEAAWWKLGTELTAVSRFAEAETALRRSMSLTTRKRMWSFVAMGSLYRAKGDFAEAETWFRRGIDDTPEDAQGYILLGAMLARLGRLSEAETLHRDALRCKSGCIYEAYYNLGLVLRAQERYAEAMDSFDAALKLDPEYKIARLAKRDAKHAMEICSRDVALNAKSFEVE